MAPTSLHLLPRAFKSNGGHSTGLGASLGGGVIGFIIILMVLTFCIVFYLEYSKASKIRNQTGRPILKGPIFKKAFLYAITIGIAGCCCAECFDDTNGDVPVQNNGDGVEYSQPQMQEPMPSYQQPGMNWTPMDNAAQAPVQ